MKTEFKRNKDGSVNISFKSITQGKALAICFALVEHAKQSPVAEDLRLFLRNAIYQDSSYDYRNENQELFESLESK
jgi:hypothetical protein